VTLEHELFSTGNAVLMREIFLSLHPQSGPRWTADIDGVPAVDRQGAFVDLLKSTRTRKGDFAQQLAQRIEDGAVIHVPDYLWQAILAVAG
jgi:putative ATP-dependent endonuclease of the OLD family